MPTTNMEFNEKDVTTLVANAVREQHKLKKDHEVKTIVIIDRDEAGENPTINIHAEFDKGIEAKGGKK